MDAENVQMEMLAITVKLRILYPFEKTWQPDLDLLSAREIITETGAL